ncbi:putative type II secretion system protein E [Parageobacillus caldoxylosilyticus NBRC 107762]|uniref:Putative type II secretion system protein E n=1 Tax=Parageobacillus caldoxylosilyticus NBRC 107762 TaxID=1220594 RepID=A0A023DA53_9BACL|nr:type IV pilus assembly protein PilB [Parageobacillus caldoxylosilyticus]GAJ38245.1 putative type II secretion system protein E [Parageobacillus caldoxylosilyticus NBRC 107762]
MDIDFHLVDLRVSTLPTIYSEKIVMRVLDLGAALNDIHKLGFNQLNLQRFIDLIERPTGIVLITGPTGSGKSSTLYAALNHLNSEEVNIITIEDPVEYEIEGVNQIQVNPNVGLTFAQGLRSILRQDPNIIMVGEIRDRETAEVAIRASLTGHLVLSTLHTNDALSTITRLIDMGIEPFLVATSLAGVVSQRLVRRVCRDCREEREPTKRKIEIFARHGMKIEKLIRGRGCPTCNMTGYRGRMAVHELLVMTEEMRRVILNKEPFSKLRELAIKNHMIFLIDDGLLKVKQGLTTLNVVENEVIAKVMKQARDALESGQSLAEPMRRHWASPPLVTQMIAIGEETGSLDAMLAKVADFYEAEVDAGTDRLKSLIEPLMIVLLAGLVGTIVTSITVPMYDVFNHIQQ